MANINHVFSSSLCETMWEIGSLSHNRCTCPLSRTFRCYGLCTCYCAREVPRNSFLIFLPLSQFVYWTVLRLLSAFSVVEAGCFRDQTLPAGQIAKYYQMQLSFNRTLPCWNTDKILNMSLNECHTLPYNCRQYILFFQIGYKSLKISCYGDVVTLKRHSFL